MRHLTLAAAAAVLCTAATGAAAPQPLLYRISLTATAHQQWDHAGAPVTQSGCTRTLRSEGIRDIVFRTRRSTVARLVGGRLLSVDLRGIAGTVTLRGANETRDTCGPQSIADCIVSKRSFSGARTRLTSPSVGTLVFNPVRGVNLRAAPCPREFADVLRAPAGPIPRATPLPVKTLTGQRTSSVTLTRTMTQTVPFSAPEAGVLRQRAVWKLTFVRIRKP